MVSANITIQELAKRLGMKTDAVYRRARAGKIRGYNLDGVWRFSEDQILEYLRARENTRHHKPTTPSVPHLQDRMPPGEQFLI